MQEQNTEVVEVKDSIRVDTQEAFHKSVEEQTVDEKPVEQEAPEEEVIEEGEEEEESAESASDEGQEEAEEETEASEGEDKPKPRSNRLQKRINKLTKQRTDAEQRAQYLEQRLRDIEDRLSAPPEPEKVQQESSETNEPNIDDFEDVAEYIKAATAWGIKQGLEAKSAEDQKSQAQTAQQQKFQEHIQRVQEFSKTVDDFEDVISEIADTKVTADLEEILVNHPNGPKLLYSMAKEGAFDDINQIKGVSNVAYAIGKFEASLPVKQTETKRETTTAPKPIKSVGTKSSGTKKSIYDASLTQKEYEALRQEQIKARY